MKNSFENITFMDQSDMQNEMNQVLSTDVTPSRFDGDILEVEAKVVIIYDKKKQKRTMKFQ